MASISGPGLVRDAGTAPSAPWFGTVVAVRRRHGSSRRRVGSAMPQSLVPGSWSGRLALLVIALGLVLMHHVVGAHQHSAADVAPSGAAAPSLAAPDAPGEHQHAGPARPDGPVVDPHVGMTAVASSAALLHRHPDENGHDHAGSLVHLCLVALVGAVVLLLLLVIVALWRRAAPLRPGAGDVAPATAPRAPPASSRQAELQVLRL
ncbi:hypothetical protein ACFPK1_08790 [Actinomycetospora rhizophila]|uniref:Uncharacterized protein n=1 Tax=Actinomycetospora rhizophila TaxID=1416876 RepID=A0ABV9ZB89_9PSEU